jgi:hypothetical protein
MSNYSKTTDFAAKDALTTGNPNKIVKGTEIDDEFSAIQTAVNTKADVNSPALTGAPTAPTASAATNSSQLSTTAYVTAAIAAAKLALYPVGSIYTQAAVATNPATLLGFGTWAAFGAGRVMVGLDGGNALFDTVEETGGSADSIVPSHTHTASSAVTDPSHAHLFPEPFYGQGTVGNNGQGGFDGGYDAEYISTTSTAVTGITVATTVSTEGVSATDTNYQPYITVYMWKRTA